MVAAYLGIKPRSSPEPSKVENDPAEVAAFLSHLGFQR